MADQEVNIDLIIERLLEGMVHFLKCRLVAVEVRNFIYISLWH